MSARKPTVRLLCPFLMIPTTPVFPKPRWMGMPHSVSSLRDEIGGALFLEAEFGMGMDVHAGP